MNTIYGLSTQNAKVDHETAVFLVTNRFEEAVIARRVWLADNAEDTAGKTWRRNVQAIAELLRLDSETVWARLDEAL